MKNLLLTLFFFSIATLGLKGQTTILVKGQVTDHHVAGQTVWINYYGSPSGCSVKDTTVTDSNGRYFYNLVIGSGCSYGAIVVNILGCKNIYDTLYKNNYYDSTTTNPDTMIVDFKYCDTCNLKANFSDSIHLYAALFHNTSSAGANKYFWKFGDGGTSTSQNPSHTYATYGNYNVCLKIQDTVKGCVDSICKNIFINDPCKSFIASFKDSIVYPTYDAIFYNTSPSSATSFLWKFGDGNTSTSSGPLIHSYATHGTYNVCLYITDSVTGCMDSVCKNVFVLDYCKVFYANFSVATNYNDTATFTNTSASLATHYAWDFGDGFTSTAANPTHYYAAPGTYSACLYAYDSIHGCGDTICRNVMILGCSGLIPDFVSSVAVQTATFTNNTLQIVGTTTAYTWLFGDGNFSTATNPVHAYTYPNTFNVCLQASATNGCKQTVCKNVVIPPNCTGFFADFAYTDSCSGVNFSNASASAANSFSWDFGDANASNAQNPFNAYSASGTYNVCLIARDTINGCSDTACANVTIGNSLSGYIFRDSALIADSGMVYLIEVTIDTVTNDTILTAVDSVYYNSGNGSYYEFTNVTSGNYLIKTALLPGSAYYSNRIPTYYVQSSQWSGATPVTIASPCVGANITMITGTNPGGSGFVGGYVSVGANKVGDPLEQIEVLLLNMDNTPFAYTYTDANGEYKFDNVFFGSYKVVVEIFGKPSEEYPVTLSQGKPSDSNGNFEVNTKNITVKKSSTGIAPISKQGLALYPNPANTVLNIAFDAPAQGEAIISITDMTGKQVILTENIVVEGNNNIPLDVNSLNYGFYIVTVKTSSRIYTGKISIDR